MGGGDMATLGPGGWVSPGSRTGGDDRGASHRDT